MCVCVFVMVCFVVKLTCFPQKIIQLVRFFFCFIFLPGAFYRKWKTIHRTKKQKVMCVCVCVWVKYFLCAFPPYPNSQNTHTTHPHTHTDRRIKTAYKKDRNKRFVRLLYSSNSIYVCIPFLIFSIFPKIFCFPATVQIKSRKMLPEQKTIIYRFAHNCFFWIAVFM